MRRRNSRKNNEEATLERKVEAMVISEMPLDSVLTASDEMKDARKGLLAYVAAIKPDVIFVDGLFQRGKDLETYLPEVLASKPITNFLELPMKYVSDFLSSLRQASKATQIHYVLSDADEDNIKQLTGYAAARIAEENKEKVKKYKAEISRLNSEIKDIKKEDSRQAKRKATALEAQKSKVEAELGKFENDPKVIFKKPNENSIEWMQLKEQTAKAFVEKIEAMGVKVSMGKISKLNVNGFTFDYAHSYVTSSKVPMKSVTGKLVGMVNEMQRSNKELSDFIIESGHHAEPMSHPHRHKMEHKYSFIASGMVMEDQAVLKQILDKGLDPEIYLGKQGRLEACKRQQKKSPAAGVVLLGRDEDGFYEKVFTASHLAKVGRGDVKLEDMVFQPVQIVSDSHVGKKETDHRMLYAALKYMEQELDEALKSGKYVPLLINPNESLQGANYKTVYTETKKPIPEELARKLRKQKEQIIEKLKSKGEVAEFYISKVVEALDETNDPHLMNQVERYFELFTDLVTRTLMHANPKYDIAAVFTEATHIQHTVGEFGLSEVGLQTIPYKVADKILHLLEKDGAITINKTPVGQIVKKGLFSRIKACEDGGNGYEKFDLQCGENTFKVAAEHKPGSAGPNSNLPMLHVRRINSMEDDAEIFIAGHIHTPYFVVLGNIGTNDSAFVYKGATFSDYSPYGIAGGWSSPVLGYLRAEFPANKNGKGVAGVKFILSDFLKGKK